MSSGIEGLEATPLTEFRRIILQTQPVDKELSLALEEYMSHLETTKEGLQSREKATKEILQRYEAAGPGMKEIAARYAKICEEIEDVKGEIQRLEGKP